MSHLYHVYRYNFYVYKEVLIMRTNIVIDDELMANAIKATGLTTKKEVVEQGLKLIVKQNQQQAVRKLRGKLNWEGDLDEMRGAWCLMIIADTSVWIDYFNGIDGPETVLLDKKLDSDLVAVGDLILLETLQGFKSDKDYKLAKNNLLLLDQHNFLNGDLVLKASENYLKLRKKGITIRKTNDVIIASYCIEHKIPLLFSDRDFKPFVELLNLIPVLKT